MAISKGIMKNSLCKGRAGMLADDDRKFERFRARGHAGLGERGTR